jgi:MinD-like ATPase involved in chromosome partitioning or flagellar assembly
MDVLYAIAQQGSVSGNAAAETVMTARQEAQQLAPEKNLRRKAASRVKFEALDFDAIIPQHPLVIASYSPSGGVGKSSTAMNLGILIATVAENMAKQQGEGARVPRVLTLDGDIVMGSLSLRLTSKVEPNLYDLQKYIDQRTAAGFQGDAAWPSSFDQPLPGEEPMYKFTHWPDSPANFSVLAAPSDPSHFWHFGPDHYRNILRMLGRFYDVIIIDCGTDLVLDSQRAWLSHANEVFMITSPDSDRLYNCAKAARIIAAAGPHPQDRRPKEDQKIYPPLATREKLSLVVTRYDSDSGLKLDLLVDKLFPWLNEDQKFWIPDVAQDMTRANNTGRFLVKENQEYADVINRMAKHAFHRYVASRSEQNLVTNN